MTKEEEKANLTRLQKQFLIDLAKMLARYTNKELARLTGINAANLSRYKNHPPGIIVMKNFYGRLAGIIDNPFEQTNLNMEDNKDQKESKENQENKDEQNYKQEQKASPETGEGQLRYMVNWDDKTAITNELFSIYKKNDEFLRSEFSKLTTIGEKATGAWDKMAENNLILTKRVEHYLNQPNPGNQTPPAE